MDIAVAALVLAFASPILLETLKWVFNRGERASTERGRLYDEIKARVDENRDLRVENDRVRADLVKEQELRLAAEAKAMALAERIHVLEAQLGLHRGYAGT